MVRFVVFLFALSSSPAFADSSIEHEGVRLTLRASAGRPADGAWVTEVTLAYQAERRTRIRVTRARVWNERPEVVPHSLSQGQRDLGRRFLAEGTGSVRVHPGAMSGYGRVELVVRFGGERFVLVTNVERDSTPMPGTPSAERAADPGADIHLRVSAPEPWRTHIRQRLRAAQFAQCVPNRGRVVARLTFDGRRMMDVQVQLNSAGASERCLWNIFGRLVGPQEARMRVQVLIEKR